MEHQGDSGTHRNSGKMTEYHGTPRNTNRTPTEHQKNNLKQRNHAKRTTIALFFEEI